MTGMLGMSCRRCAAEGRTAINRRSGVCGAISTSDGAADAATALSVSAADTLLTPSQ